MQKHVNLVDLVKSFPTNIFLQNLASIQPRTSLIKFDHLAEKSESAVRYRTLQPAGPAQAQDEPERSKSVTDLDLPSPTKRAIGKLVRDAQVHWPHSSNFQFPHQILEITIGIFARPNF